MKIAIATAVYYPQINGVAVFSHNLAVGLAKRGHEVLVICPSLNRKSRVEMQEGVKICYLRSVDVKVYPDQVHPVTEKKDVGGVKLPKLFYRHGLPVSMFPQLEIKKILEGFKPDVVHVQVSDPIGLSVVGWARRHDVPVVTTEHNQPEVLTDSLKMPRMMKKGANVVLSAYFRNRQSKSDFVTMPTEMAVRDLLGKGEEFPVPVAAVSNGVDLACFKPGKKASEPTVLYVGRLDPEKQVSQVVEAFKQVLESVPEAKLVIAGDGVDKARLVKMVKDLELGRSVKFLGKVMPPEVYKVFQQGWVFATASPIETQGIVLIEAAASGLPLVAVDKGAVAEVCVDGVNGILCQSGSVSELADALIKILTDEKLRERFAQASVKIASEHDFERTLDKFINIYQRVIKDS